MYIKMTMMKTLAKEEIIKKLIDDDFDTIMSHYEGGYLYSILSDGFKGYNNYTKKELKYEYEARFNEKVIIK